MGKSLFMCHCAAAALNQSKNVLYITMEMSEEKIAERIDSNLLNVNIKDLVDLPKQLFETKVEKIAKKTQGTLIIKEYPTARKYMQDTLNRYLTNYLLRRVFRPILFSLIISTFVLQVDLKVLSLIHTPLSTWLQKLLLEVLL